MKKTFDYPKVFNTAFALLPPIDKCSQVQKIRQKHDSAFKRWMPHINFLFPFYDLPNFDEVADRFEKEMENISPFLVRFEKFGKFLHKKKAVMFLQPSIQKENILKKIFQQIISVTPNLKVRKEFHPHCTVGQFSLGEIEKKVVEFSKTFKPFEFICKGLHLIARKGKDDPFEIIKFVPFGSKRFSSVSITPTLSERTPVNQTTMSCSYQSLSKEIVGVNVDITLRDTKENITKSRKKVVLVLDVSGSMGGAPLNDAKTAIIDLLKSTSTSGIKYEFITYDSGSRIYEDFSNNSCISILNSLSKGTMGY